MWLIRFIPAICSVVIEHRHNYSASQHQRVPPINKSVLFSNSEKTTTVLLDDRLRRLFKNIFGSAASRLVNLLIALALVPLTINSLNSADYAFLAMAISLSVLSAYADLGIGLAIVNTLAGECENSALRRSQRAISLVWFTLLALALFALAVTGGLALWFNHFAPADDAPRYQAMLLGIACVFVGLPSGLVQRVLFARHRTTEANAWATSGRLLSLAFVWAVVHTGVATLPLLVFGVIGVPVVISWLSVFIVFGRASTRVLRPRFRHFDRRLLKPYIIIGLSFLVMQLVSYFEVGIDTLLAGTLIGIQVVPALDVYIRLFTYVPALISIALFPLWPAISHAKAEGDMGWILKVRRWAYLLVGVSSLALSLVFLLYGDTIILHWTNQQLMLPPTVLAGMAMFAVLGCLGSVQSMVLNGLGIIRQQAFLYLIYLLILFSVKSYAALTFGLEGMVWTLNICCLIRLLMTERLLRTSIAPSALIKFTPKKTANSPT